MVKDEDEADGKVALRVLLVAWVESSVGSFSLPFPAPLSRERLFLDVVALDERGFPAERADWSTESLSLSFGWSRSFSFCLAAFTLALERIGFCSATGVEVEAFGS